MSNVNETKKRITKHKKMKKAGRTRARHIAKHEKMKEVMLSDVNEILSDVNETKKRLTKHKKIVMKEVMRKVTCVTCLACGRVHFQQSKLEIQEGVDNFNEFYERSLPGVRELYGNRKARLEDSKVCFGCGGSYLNFRNALDRDSPKGVTLTVILDRRER